MHKVDFNDKWIFIKEVRQNYVQNEITDGEYVTTPHSYNGIDGQSGDGMYKGKCCYQKKVALTAEELKEYHYLEIGAASLVSNVYINGELAGGSRCGFSMYRVFLNPLLKVGENLISIVVENSRFYDVYPLMADFSFYGGIYREVSWITTKALHFELLDNSRDGIYVTQKATKEGIYELKIKGRVINELCDGLESKMVVTLLDKEGKLLFSETKNITVADKEDFELTEELNQPRLWQGIEDPYLHTLKVEL